MKDLKAAVAELSRLHEQAGRLVQASMDPELIARAQAQLERCRRTNPAADFYLFQAKDEEREALRAGTKTYEQILAERAQQ